MTPDVLAKLFEHNNWANVRLLETCTALSDAQLDKTPVATSTWSVRRALSHLVECQQGYLSLLTLPPQDRPHAAPPFAALLEAVRASGEGLLAQARADGGAHPSPRQTTDGYRVESWVVLVQAINHATDHRRQVCDLLRAQGLTAPQLDGWGFGETEGALVRDGQVGPVRPPRNAHTLHKLALTRERPPRTGPLAACNVGFHEAYTQLVEQTLAQLGASLPVLVLIGDDVTLLCDGGEHRELVIPDRYHELKALDHLAFGVQLTLMANGSGSLTDATSGALREWRAQIRELQTSADVSAPVVAELLRCLLALVERVLADGVVDLERLREHLRSLVPLATEIALLAVGLELDPLHALVGRWRAHLGEERWAGAYVVICANHQPRYREAACQYFGQLLDEPGGFAAEREDRLLYGEGLADLDAALDLLARHIVDQRASHLLFGDRHRLQEDFLADAATTHLQQLFPDARA